MEIKDKLISELNSRYFPPRGATLVVAVSGGVDSVVLLHVISLLSVSWDWEIIVAHFNHNLRKLAIRDAKFVKELAASLGLKFVLGSADVKKVAAAKKMTIEEAGRVERYRWLQTIAKKYRAERIVTAHTADDQTETVIMNWLRGGLVRALSGMREKEGNIWRPFLRINKTELIKFVKHYHIQFREDKTNRDVMYTRNLIRHQLLPILDKINPSFRIVLSRNTESWSNLENWLDQQLNDIYKKASLKGKSGEVIFNEDKFKELNPFWQNELLLMAVQQIKGDRQDWSKAHLDEAKAVIDSARKTSWKQLPGKLFLSRGYGKISISCYQPKFIDK